MRRGERCQTAFPAPRQIRLEQLVDPHPPPHVEVRDRRLGLAQPPGDNLADLRHRLDHRSFTGNRSGEGEHVILRNPPARTGALDSGEIDAVLSGYLGHAEHVGVIVDAVDALRGAGVTSLNFDLMYGLPGQSRDDLLDSLQRTRVLGADRIALFGYAHVPHIVPRQRVIDATRLPAQAERFAMAWLGYAYLCTHGYVPVGFDHFARPGGDALAHATLEGNLRRNFQGFTDDDAPNLIGLGASAISAFPHLLAQNEKNSGRYRMMVSQGQTAARRGILRSPDDAMRGRIIEQLLCQGRALLPPLLETEVAEALRPFITRNLATLERGHLSIAPDGLPYARTIATLFDPYREQSPQRFSSAV